MTIFTRRQTAEKWRLFIVRRGTSNTKNILWAYTTLLPAILYEKWWMGGSVKKLWYN